MFVNRETQNMEITYKGKIYNIMYTELSAVEDDRILQRALSIQRAAGGGQSVSARSRLVEINRDRFMAIVKGIDYDEDTHPPGTAKPVHVEISPDVYDRLSRGFRDLILEKIINPRVQDTLSEEEKEAFRADS